MYRIFSRIRNRRTDHWTVSSEPASGDASRAGWQRHVTSLAPILAACPVAGLLMTLAFRVN